MKNLKDRTKLQIWIDESLYKAFDHECSTLNITKSKVINVLIREFILDAEGTIKRLKQKGVYNE